MFAHTFVAFAAPHDVGVGPTIRVMNGDMLTVGPLPAHIYVLPDEDNDGSIKGSA